MPTYEYGCEACGAEFERSQRISEDPIKDCPKCGEPKARRLISGGNFILKGSGWYADLYHKPAPSKKEDKPAKDAAASKPEPSSASKSSDGGSSTSSSTKKAANE